MLLAGALLIASLFIGAGAATVSVTIDSIEPASLMPGDMGTVTATLKNIGSNFTAINQIYIKDSEGIVPSGTSYYNPIGGVNPGDSLTVSVPIVAGQKEGVFYPVFYIDFNDGVNYLKYPFKMVVSNESVSVSVVSRPDVFDPASTQTLGLKIGNLRTNAVDAVQVKVSGVGVSSNQETVYVGTIAEGESKPANLTVLTSEDTKEIIIEVVYRNGANWHTKTMTIPVEGGESKTGADIIVNNIEVKSGASYMTITGDVNNAGLTSAKGMIVTTEGVEKTQPYESYVVGSLDADGLSEFEVTFAAPESGTATLVFTYKDTNGNVYVHKEQVSTGAAPAAAAGSASSGNGTMATVIVVILVIIVAGGALLAWKKGNLFAKKERK